MRMKAVEVPVERVVRTMAALREPVERMVRTMAALMREPTRMKVVEVFLDKQGREQTTG